VEEKVVVPPQPPKRFPVSTGLASGGPPGGFPSRPFNPPYTGSYTYRMADVRVGDRVAIEYYRVDGVDICAAIRIERRPDGRVPPAPGDEPPANLRADLYHLYYPRHHERCNAYQDWEEKGIPLPAAIATAGPFLEPPYPPVAPAPREVQPKSPPVKQ
jgi:hypothetical protein